MTNKFSTIILACSLVLVVPAMAQETREAVPTPSAAPQTLSLTTAHGVFASSITATGRVLAIKSAKIGPRVSGRLAEFGQVDGQPLEVGMSVKKGQSLFSLDSATFENSLTLAKAALDSAKANLANLTAPTRAEKITQLQQELAQLQVREQDKSRERDRYKRLVEVEKTLPLRRLEEVEVEYAATTAQRKAAEARLLEAQNGPTASEIAVADARVKEAQAAVQIAMTDLNDATVKAPFEGVITQRFKSAGDFIASQPPTDVLELVGLSELEAEIALPENYLPGLTAGQTRLLIKSPLLSQPLSLPITRIVSQVDTTRGTFIVRVRIPNEQRERLIAGAFVTAELPLSRDGGGVIIPARAISTDKDGKSCVFLVHDGKMVQQQVQPGDKLSEGVIVTGVKDGAQLLLGPAEDLADGKPLPDYLK